MAWRGFAFGVVTGTAALLLLALGAARHGVVVHVNPAELGPRVEVAVQSHVAARLPADLARARAALPDAVATRVASGLLAGKLNLGVLELEIPTEARVDLEQRLTRVLAEAGTHFLDQVDQAELAARAGREARLLVEGALFRAPGGYRLVLQPAPWLTVPVTVRARPG